MKKKLVALQKQLADLLKSKVIKEKVGSWIKFKNQNDAGKLKLNDTLNSYKKKSINSAVTLNTSLSKERDYLPELFRQIKPYLPKLS